jgi:signal transduction histidine kinase
VPGVISIFLAGTLLTILAFYYLRWEIRESYRHRLGGNASIYTGMITNEANQYVTLMLSLRNFFEFSETVTRDEFTGFTSMLLSQEQGLKALFWVPQVRESQRPDYELNARKEGFLKFSFHTDSVSGQPGEKVYFPAYYIEPFDINSSIFGCDLNREKDLSEGFEKAIQTNKPAAVMKVFPSAESAGSDGKENCWIIVPVFNQHGLICTEEGRRQNLKGYLVGVVDFSVSLNSIASDAESNRVPLNFYVENITTASHRMPQAKDIHSGDSGVDKDSHQILNENTFQFADQTWKISCIYNQESPLNQGSSWIIWLVFPVGFLLTGLLVLYLYGLCCRNELADDLVEKRTGELKEQKQKADAIAVEMERSNRTKSVFLASMSHDIRTPMNAILGFCELLAEEPMDHNQKQYVNLIHESSSNLLMLLNDILDLSKIEAGRMHIESRDCDLHEILKQVEQMFKIPMQNRGLEFRILASADMLGIIQSDPSRIRQCLVNLVGNATKFTHQGHIHVSIVLDKLRGQLKVIVEDTGVGIPEVCLENLFDAFSQIEGTYGQAGKYSNGLGLSITRQLARLMGGDVTVTSRVGHGSVFTLEIPVKLMEHEVQQIPQGAGVGGGWTGV